MPSQITPLEILTDFMNSCLENQKKPSSLSSFVKNQSYTLEDIHFYFKSLKAIEQAIFSHFFEHTLELLARDPETANYDFKTHTLAFYFTFFELLSANKEYVLMALKEGLFELQNFYKLETLRPKIKHYFGQINDLSFLPLPNKMSEKTFQETMWWQFLTVLKFWMQDTSEHFEKTDVFIEKSVAANHDMLRLTQWDNILGWGKFLAQESRLLK